MPIEILMPALSPTMTEGNLAKWTKKEGDKIKPGDVIAEIETDKATMEVEAVDGGIMGKIIVPAGTESVKVNALIAVLLEEGEDKKALENFKASSANENKAAAAPVPTTAAPAAAPAPAPVAASGTAKASPLAKRIAEQKGVNLSGIQGTGPHGRIIRADVEEAKSSPAAGGRTAAAVSYGRNPVETTEIPNGMMRKVIAKRLLESKQTVPHFYLSVDCDINNLLAARERINDAAPKDKEGKPAYKISVNDMVIKATAQALKTVPAANATWTDVAILQYNNIDISVAVAIDGGLITPIVKNADQKSLAAISGEVKDLAGRARKGTLKPEEFQGGGFSISNLGMYGVKSFSAIVNPPQSCILAVGSSEERPVVKGGKIEIATIMNVTLSVDHRSVDGAVGAEFLAAFKRYIEDPIMMMV
jgi:pyruvate dehydrogenase E2 component (dihydrolipoamide acetyltransferase)